VQLRDVSVPAPTNSWVKLSSARRRLAFNQVRHRSEVTVVELHLLFLKNCPTVPKPKLCTIRKRMVEDEGRTFR